MMMLAAAASNPFVSFRPPDITQYLFQNADLYETIPALAGNSELIQNPGY